MANTENNASKPTAAVKEKRVELFIPKGYANEEPNHLISVNGVNYVLPKGKKSLVPDFVAEEYHRSQRAQAKLDEKMEQMLEASK
jgi:hypothetical protein